jgi:hypothetical protein
MKTTKNVEAVEAANPGLVAVAGPFAVNLKELALARYEKALCVRSYRDQRAACPRAKIVMHGKYAWVVRKKPLVKHEKNQHIKFASKLGIKAGRGS